MRAFSVLDYNTTDAKVKAAERGRPCLDHVISANEWKAGTEKNQTRREATWTAVIRSRGLGLPKAVGA